MDFHDSYSRMKNNFKPKYIIYTMFIAFIIIIATNATYTIEEQEQAVLTTLGKPVAISESGLHFKLPFIQKVQKVDTTIKAFTVGYNADTQETVSSEALMITSDFNFVNVDFYIEFRVSDPVKALYASKDPYLILEDLSHSAIRNIISNYDVDSVLTTGKNAIQAEIKEMIIEKLDVYDIGIQLINVSIQDSEPPTVEVMSAFKNVETAKQDKETTINKANKYRNERIPAAEAEIDRIIKNAEANKEERINEANGQVARFNSLYEEYSKFPLITKERMFYETMEEVLPDLEVIIDGSDGVSKVLPLEPFVSTSATNTSKEEQ